MKVKKDFGKRTTYLKKGQIIVQSPDNCDMVAMIGQLKCVVRHV
jgi:hypothetical protein